MTISRANDKLDCHRRCVLENILIHLVHLSFEGMKSFFVSVMDNQSVSIGYFLVRRQCWSAAVIDALRLMLAIVVHFGKKDTHG